MSDASQRDASGGNTPAQATADWLAVVVSQGGASPLLIVADNRSIAEQALAWDRSLSEAGWEYRVRLGEVAGQQAACEAGLMAREAAGFGACLHFGGGQPRGGCCGGSGCPDRGPADGARSPRLTSRV